MFTFKENESAESTSQEVPTTTKVHTKSYEGKLRDQIFWSLGMRRPFIVNDEYKIELLHIDFDLYRAKIKVTNLKTQLVEENTVDMDNGDDEII